MHYREEPSLCDTCVGACCQNVKMALTQREANFLRQVGTILEPIFPPITRNGEPSEVRWADVPRLLKERARQVATSKLGEMVYIAAAKQLGPSEGLYDMKGVCGYLDEHNRCTVYDDDLRPRVCHDFPVNGSVCNDLYQRTVALQPVPVEIVKKPTVA